MDVKWVVVVVEKCEIRNPSGGGERLMNDACIPYNYLCPILQEKRSCTFH